MGIRSQSNPNQSFNDVFSNTGIEAVGAPPPGSITGHTATGGVISDYSTPTGDIYRAHIFTASGTFDVSALGTGPADVEYVVVAGGGGGYGGGGGAGGYRSSITGESTGGGGSLESALPISTSPGSYTVTVGAGGRGSDPGSSFPVAAKASVGSNSQLGPTVISTGGGMGTGPSGPQTPASPGGSGGGTGANYAAGDGTSGQGYAGGQGNSGSYSGGGGGGAGSVGGRGGGPAPTNNNNIGGHGGAGLRTGAAGPLYPVGQPGPGGGTGWLAGGGGGQNYPGSGAGGSGGGPGGPYAGAGNGGTGGASLPAESRNGKAGVQGSGSGGGGGYGPTPSGGASGGSGIVIVRYQIGSSDTQTAKATGGSISFYGGKTIHTFLNTSTLTLPGTFNETVEYVVVAGGGGGGGSSGGGGGAGGYMTGSASISGPQTRTVTIGAGGRANVLNDLKNGGNSVLGWPGTDKTAMGGGGGGGNGNFDSSGAGQPGGSGGGSRNQTSNQGSAQLSQGNDGAAGGSNPTIRGGGGGGYGGAGSAGAGGIGVQLPTTFRDPASTVGTPGPQPAGFYVAGGGGAGTSYSTPAPNTIGGYGGGGNGGRQDIGTRGAANTGGGGGGGGFDSAYYQGSEGGSGIVLIAYPT
tara:strand:- start:85 stop:1986 length:1902 start_codon:yes stop_codon:yes gene_type:complete